MLTKEQLNSKLYPRECWININQNYKRGIGWSTRQDAMNATDNAAGVGTKTIYRIHVRLK